MGKHSKVTINTIAEHLDVSAITVSRALANQPGVSDELRQTIVRTAKELGYKRCKRKSKVNILFLIRHRYVADHSNFSQLVEGIEENLLQIGAELTVEFVDAEKQSKLDLPSNLKRGKRFDGVILLGKFEEEYARNVCEVVSPMVVINGGSDTLKTNYIYYNYNRIGYLACQYLIERGHRQIAFVESNDSLSRDLRYFGFMQAFRDSGLSSKSHRCLNGRFELDKQIDNLIAESMLPTAFVCQSDRIALKLIKVLHERQISVPHDVSVIGSGNSEFSSMSIPAITTFDVNITTVCELAVNTLLNQIRGKTEVVQTIYVDATLVERDSVQNLIAEGETKDAAL